MIITKKIEEKIQYEIISHSCLGELIVIDTRYGDIGKYFFEGFNNQCLIAPLEKVSLNSFNDLVISLKSIKMDKRYEYWSKNQLKKYLSKGNQGHYIEKLSYDSSVKKLKQQDYECLICRVSDYKVWEYYHADHRLGNKFKDIGFDLVPVFGPCYFNLGILTLKAQKQIKNLNEKDLKFMSNSLLNNSKVKKVVISGGSNLFERPTISHFSFTYCGTYSDWLSILSNCKNVKSQRCVNYALIQHLVPKLFSSNKSYTTSKKSLPKTSQRKKETTC